MKVLPSIAFDEMSGSAKAVQIGDPRSIAAEDYDIKADYEAVHGAVSAGAPKVFFKYFYVNTATNFYRRYQKK